MPSEKRRGGSFDLIFYKTPPPPNLLYFTGCKLHPSGIGIEATEVECDPGRVGQAELTWLCDCSKSSCEYGATCCRCIDAPAESVFISNDGGAHDSAPDEPRPRCFHDAGGTAAACDGPAAYADGPTAAWLCVSDAGTIGLSVLPPGAQSGKKLLPV